MELSSTFARREPELPPSLRSSCDLHTFVVGIGKARYQQGGRCCRRQQDDLPCDCAYAQQNRRPINESQNQAGMHFHQTMSAAPISRGYSHLQRHVYVLLGTIHHCSSARNTVRVQPNFRGPPSLFNRDALPHGDMINAFFVPLTHAFVRLKSILFPYFLYSDL